MNKHHVTKHKLIGLLRYIPLLLYVGFFVVAFSWVVMASFSTTKEIFSNEMLSSGLHFENYTKIWTQNHVGRYFLNSLIVTIIPCALLILISAPAAYALAKKTFIGRHLVFNSFVVGMSVPGVMLIIPIFIWFVRAKLVGHLITLIIIYTSLNVPYTVYFLAAFFSTVPSSLAEAAMIDGCTEIKAMWKIMIPMASPGIITITIFNFIGIWNEYFDALIFANGNDEIRTLSMGLQNIITTMTYTGNWAGLFAGLIIALVPTIILYLFLSERIVSGITAGGVKG